MHPHLQRHPASLPTGSTLRVPQLSAVPSSGKRWLVNKVQGIHHAARHGAIPKGGVWQSWLCCCWWESLTSGGRGVGVVALFGGCVWVWKRCVGVEGVWWCAWTAVFLFLTPLTAAGGSAPVGLLLARMCCEW